MNISVTRTCESRRPRRVRRRDRTLQNNGLRRSSTSMRKNALRDFQERRLLLTVPATGHSIPAAFPDLIPTRASKAVKKKFDIFFFINSRVSVERHGSTQPPNWLRLRKSFAVKIRRPRWIFPERKTRETTRERFSDVKPPRCSRYSRCAPLTHRLRIN